MADITKQIFDVKYKYFDGSDWVLGSDRILAPTRDEAIELAKKESSCPFEFKDTVCVTVCVPFRMRTVAIKLP